MGYITPENAQKYDFQLLELRRAVFDLIQLELGLQKDAFGVACFPGCVYMHSKYRHVCGTIESFDGEEHVQSPQSSEFC